MECVTTHQHQRNSTLRQTVENFQKSFESETKKINIKAQNIKEEGKEKRMHGKFPCSLNEKLVDKEQSCRWLKFGVIKEETGSRVVAPRVVTAE
jgi:hypothetical protein